MQVFYNKVFEKIGEINTNQVVLNNVIVILKDEIVECYEGRHSQQFL